jgi:thiamine transporter ThiT
MLSPAAVVLQVAIIVLAVAGLVILAIRRRFEALLLGGLILGLTVFSGIVLAAPRRNLALMPLVITLASTGLVSVVVYVRAALQTRGLQPRLDP